MIIYTHPNNLELIKQKSRTGELLYKGHYPYGILMDATVVASATLPEKEWSGNYVDPNGNVINPKQFSLKIGFIEYDENDLTHLIYVGILQKHYQHLYYVINQWPSY